MTYEEAGKNVSKEEEIIGGNPKMTQILDKNINYYNYTPKGKYTCYEWKDKSQQKNKLKRLGTIFKIIYWCTKQ